MSRRDRLALLERPADEIPLATQAALLGLTRTHLYDVPVPPSPKELRLKRQIDELFTARPFYGVRKITAQLRKEGYLVNHKAVARHMREMGLAAIYPGPNLSKRAHAHAVYPYLLRAVTAQRPNHVWGIDITYLRLRQGWMYLVAVLDWYSRYSVSWALDQTLQAGFVLEAVEAAFAVATPTIWKSAQGSHVTSPHSTQRLRAAGVKISMDSTGRALDNIFTERLWRTIKYAEVYLADDATPREARTGLSTYLQFYNQARVHQALDYRTPAEVYR